MQPSIFLPSHPRPSPKDAIPYSSAALRQDLERLRGIWDDCQASRDRNAIYEADRARRALRMQRLKVSDREEPFAAVIRCTADPAKADKRTRSKWSRVMRYAAAHKPSDEPLGRFIRRKGGINACAARFSRWLGRGTRLQMTRPRNVSTTLRQSSVEFKL
jgi:hypothetical protein